MALISLSGRREAGMMEFGFFAFGFLIFATISAAFCCAPTWVSSGPVLPPFAPILWQPRQSDSTHCLPFAICPAPPVAPAFFTTTDFLAIGLFLAAAPTGPVATERATA